MRPILSSHELAGLVTAAADGDRDAFEAIVKQFSALVWSVARDARLSRAESEDAIQGVWLRLLQNLRSIRDPSRLAGWIATTTRRECLSVIRSRGRLVSINPQTDFENRADTDADPAAPMLLAERRRIVSGALAALDERCRQLLTLLSQTPPIAYDDIGAMLEMPVGSIGPTRSRCLDKLRRNPGVSGLLGSR